MATFFSVRIQKQWKSMGKCDLKNNTECCFNYFNLRNYCLETVNRIDCQVGGVGLYVLNDIDYKLRDDLRCQNEVYESCFIEINRSEDKNIILGVVYRHHHKSINEFNNQLENCTQ